MSEDIKDKYEEAAKAYCDSDQSLKDWIAAGKPDSKFYQNVLSFIAGAVHAEEINEAFIQKLRKLIEEKDEQMLLQVGIHQQAEKEAYNRAIKDVMVLLNRTVAFGWLERDWINLKADLEKLKKL